MAQQTTVRKSKGYVVEYYDRNGNWKSRYFNGFNDAWECYKSHHVADLFLFRLFKGLWFIARK